MINPYDVRIQEVRAVSVSAFPHIDEWSLPRKGHYEEWSLLSNQMLYIYKQEFLHGKVQKCQNRQPSSRVKYANNAEALFSKKGVRGVTNKWALTP